MSSADNKNDTDRWQQLWIAVISLVAVST